MEQKPDPNSVRHSNLTVSETAEVHQNRLTTNQQVKPPNGIQAEVISPITFLRPKVS